MRECWQSKSGEPKKRLVGTRVRGEGGAGRSEAEISIKGGLTAMETGEGGV